MIKLLLVLSSFLPQDAVKDAPVAVRPWQTVDRIVMVVNQDIITSSRLERDMKQITKTRKLTSDTEIRAAETQILTDRVKERLRVQAGANLGVDEKMIDARVADSLERMRERENGMVGLAKFLGSRDISGPDVKRLLRDDIYEQIWQDGLTGEAPGPLGRVTADRYVRPGALRLLFDAAIENPADMKALGGSVGQVQFQQVVIDAAESGGIDAARALARAIAARIEAGEDMAAIARANGASANADGITDVEEARLRELFPEIAEFTAKATPNQISPPIESVSRGKTFVRIVRFLERKAAVVPDFASAVVQETLRKGAQRRLEVHRLESAYGPMLRASYVWPEELAGRKP